MTFDEKIVKMREGAVADNSTYDYPTTYSELILQALSGSGSDTPFLETLTGLTAGTIKSDIGGGPENPFWDVNGDYSDGKPYLNTLTGLTVDVRDSIGVVNTPSSEPVNDINNNNATMLALQKGILGNLNGSSVVDRAGDLQNPFYDTNGDFGSNAPFLKLITSRLPQAGGLLATKILLSAGNSYSVTTTAISQNTVLTAGAKGVSIYALSSDVYFEIGDGTQTASATSCYLPQGQRLDFDLTSYENPNIAFIYGTLAAATVVKFNELN